jgi:hypothetical protein
VGHLAKPKQGTTVLLPRIFPLPAAIQGFAENQQHTPLQGILLLVKHRNSGEPPNLCSMPDSTTRLHKALLPLKTKNLLLFHRKTEFTLSTTIRSHHIKRDRQSFSSHNSSQDKPSDDNLTPNSAIP